MGFTFLSNSLSTNHQVQTEIKDYGDRLTYPINLTLQVSTGDGYVTFGISFHTREVAQASITELVGKCNGWLADELGIHRGPPPPEEVWPEAEQETLSTSTPAARPHKAPGSLGPGGVGR